MVYGVSNPSSSDVATDNRSFSQNVHSKIMVKKCFK